MKSSSPHGRMLCIQRLRALRVFAALGLIALLFVAPAVQAGPITINQVIQTLTPNQGPANLIVTTVTQDPVGGGKVTTTTTGTTTNGPTQPASGDAPKLDGLLSNMSVVQDPQNVGVEIVEQAEVEGSICDCGDILLPAGGFAKWPLLFLAAVPLAFIHECKDCDTPSSTPTPTPPSTPTPTPTPTPEPASLLLLGTGLLAAGASLRRRARGDGSKKE